MPQLKSDSSQERVKATCNQLLTMTNSSTRKQLLQKIINLKSKICQETECNLKPCAYLIANGFLNSDQYPANGRGRDKLMEKLIFTLT